MVGWFMLSMEDEEGLKISGQQKRVQFGVEAFLMFVLNLDWRMGVQLGQMGVQAGGTTIGPVRRFGRCCGALHWAFEVGSTLGPRNFHSFGMH